ncbi:hypothetical protein T03_11761 [Trichinella britovi]|uniref:Uncharacterized protein n=1 Tax=Trichinella britovi TaxID=45882 RepID=A0A0V1CU80_TRIBR|nr:hypothetical protein T03_11761 [Trichinella britovi]
MKFPYAFHEHQFTCRYVKPISLLVCVEMSKSIVLLNSRHVHRYQISMEEIELNKNNKNKNEKKNTEKSANEQA